VTSVLVDFLSQQDGDAPGFIEIVQNIATGLVREQKPKRLYVIRIDNWFGPKWLTFAGKFSVTRGLGFGVHKKRLHVPPFVPARVVSERVFSGPDFMETVPAEPLHIDCPSNVALNRRIEDFDSDAVFVWFSSESQQQRRGAVMIYSTTTFSIAAQNIGFYAGFATTADVWQPAMLRGISRSELDGLVDIGTADRSGLQPSTAS
jgi:hypothetical protein